MPSLEGRNMCKGDEDCSEKQYCYDVSGFCVDYTLCSRYNRQEAQTYSRHPSQCGPCISGYNAEVLSTGEVSSLCKRITSDLETAELHQNTSNAMFTLVGSISIFVVLGIIISITVLKKVFFSRSNDACDKCPSTRSFDPSAPPVENNHLIEFELPLHPPASNNNENLKDRNKLVNATPFKEPDWIRGNSSYEQHLRADSPNAAVQLLPQQQLQSIEESDHNTWSQEQGAVQESSQPFAVEQRDNDMNAAFNQRIRPLPSSEGESNNASDSGNSHESDNQSSVRNFLISQKITMNLNVLNGDYK
ncbi:uncharacterized protein LOC105704330 [Orussus abietinus]|uniref:uncharacterized protein LOC105704330 n=1 Tax=Orussus abietinus TaxID=222816 RepID=UPI000626B975|nr:uncharacterized protein LOC105704330 [Orussus abietinus]